MSKKVLLISFVVFYIANLTSSLCFNCNNQTDSNLYNIKLKQDSIFFENFELNIRTTYVEIELFDETGVKLDETTLKQELVFYSDGVKLRTVEWPSKKIKGITKEGNTINIKENIVYELGVLQGNSGQFFYSIIGGGHYNASPEQFVFYSFDGIQLWLNVSNRYKIFKKEGNFRNVFLEFNVDSLKWFNGDYQRIFI